MTDKDYQSRVRGGGKSSMLGKSGTGVILIQEGEGVSATCTANESNRRLRAEGKPMRRKWKERGGADKRQPLGLPLGVVDGISTPIAASSIGSTVKPRVWWVPLSIPLLCC